MKRQPFHWHQYLAALAALALCAPLPVRAQGRGGGGGLATGGGRGPTGASTSKYPASGTIGDAYFSIDPESRRVVTIADEDTSRALSLVLSNLDRPKPQVLIKVVFIEVTYNNASDIGIEGGWGKAIGNGATANAAQGFGLSPLSASGGTNLNVLGQDISQFGAVSPISAPGGAGLYQILGANYQATLRAIAQAGSVKVLSRPSILARNNQPATITVGEYVPLVTSINYTTFGQPILSPTYTPVGVILQVTPFITADSLVEMIIAPQISSIDPTLSFPLGSGISAPVIDVRSANTVAVTPSGRTVIIGGLMQNSKTRTDTKIPFLGDIPLLGNLFKRTQVNDTKTELIIFLTPYIAETPTELVSISNNESKKADVQKAFTEQELNKFLDNLPKKSKNGAAGKP